MNKKILITGINGFIGTYCGRYFSRCGCSVYGTDLAGYNAENAVKFIPGEVDVEKLRQFGEKFDAVIHAAGTGTVGYAQKMPEIEREKTVGSLRNVLEYIKEDSPETRLVFISSAAVYGDSYNRPIKEDDKVNPVSEYGKHKLEAEMLCREYTEKYGSDISVIRFFSIYGECLRKQLIWDYCNRIDLNSETIDCFGTGKEKRDFIHIYDAVALIAQTVKTKNSYGTINGGSGIQTSVDEILTMINNAFEYKGKKRYDNISRPGNPEILTADITKAKLTGFKPEVTIENGINRYVAWYKANR